jgi:hypothetical protein
MKLDVADETLIGRRKAVSSAGILRTPMPMPSNADADAFEERQKRHDEDAACHPQRAAERAGANGHHKETRVRLSVHAVFLVRVLARAGIANREDIALPICPPGFGARGDRVDPGRRTATRVGP